MTDLQIAKNSLEGHTIALCRDGAVITDDKRGVAPMLGFIDGGVDLTGYSVADLVVGKAAALLFIKAGIKQVFARTLSEKAKTVLEKYSIPYSYEILTSAIINRAGTDICPMEKTVAATDDPEQAYALISAQAALLKSLN